MKQMAPDQNPRKNEQAHELLAMTDFLQGNFASAANHFAEANPDDNYIWYYRGLALEKAGKTAEARQYFKRAAEWNFSGSGTALTKRDASKKIS
jgi:Flp pilus assembly protein TadD